MASAISEILRVTRNRSHSHSLLPGRLPAEVYGRVEALLTPLRADVREVLFDVDVAIDTVPVRFDPMVPFDQQVNEPAARHHPMAPSVARSG